MRSVWVRVVASEVSALGGSPQNGIQHYIRMEIQDEGPGLSADDKSKLFSKFARLSAQPTGGEHSTGLGLSIVKKLVEAMHGRVWCESKLGKGSTFIVEMPVASV
jgi:signal transduction histidine kinase